MDAARRAGFAIDATGGGDNPVYEVRLGDGLAPLSCFSKVHDAPPNPREGFAVVMVCTDADEACPSVPGADARIALPYHDPKAADGTPDEAAVYDERCADIARELLYAMSRAADPAGGPTR